MSIVVVLDEGRDGGDEEEEGEGAGGEWDETSLRMIGCEKMFVLLGELLDGSRGGWVPCK